MFDRVSLPVASTADPEAERWQAVVDRDAAADGRFVYAVSTTGVYCRPTCPARRPRREHVVFFADPSAAERAGFRACLRCHPEGVSSSVAVVEHIKQLIEASLTALSLAELGLATGLSGGHVQRLFKRATGLSPKAYAQARRAERLRDGLRQGATVTDALYQAGYGSPRALYSQADATFGMTPGAYRHGGRNERIAYACGETTLGTAIIAATARGVCAVRFGEPAELIAELAAEFPHAEIALDAAAVGPYHAWLRNHLATATAATVTPPVDVRGTAFQRQVWSALQAIPRGQRRTYTQVAAAVGRPAAVRAVANACAANPVAVLVPCHRVVRSDGGLGGYRWGEERKRALLASEGE